MSKAKEMLKIAGFEDTPEGRAAFYKRFPTSQSWEKKYGNGGNVMSYEAGGPTTPMVGPDMYAQGGYTFPQPTGDIFDMMGLPQINAYMHGGDVEAYGSGDSIIGGGAGGLNFFPDRKSFIGGIYENYGLDPKRLERFARNSALYPTELTTAGFDRTGITGGMALNRTKKPLYGVADAYLTGSAGKVNTMTRLPEDGSIPGMKSEWREASQPFASIGVNAEMRNYLSAFGPSGRIDDRNRRGFTTAGGNAGVGLQYENNSISPYLNINPRIGYNFGKRLLTGKKSLNDQPFTAYAGMNATVNDLPAIAGKDVPWYDSMLTGASKAEWTAGLEGRIGSRNGTWNVTGSLSSPMVSPEQNYGSYEKAGTFQQQTGKGPRFNVGIKRKFAEGGDIQDVIATANRYDNWLNPTDRPMYGTGGNIDEVITTANRYDNWLNPAIRPMYAAGGDVYSTANRYNNWMSPPKYGLGDWIPGVGDVALGVLDTGLSVLGGQDIIGDKQYSDTGFGKTMQDVSHYTGSIAESIVPTAISYIPGIGQILSPALNAAQMGVDALTPDDIRRMNSESGHKAAFIGAGLDLAGAVTSLGTGAAKAGITTAKLAKAAKVANTVNKVAKGVKTASDIYNVASDPNASGADWLGAAAGGFGTAGSFAGSDALQQISKVGKLGAQSIKAGQALSSGRLDAGQSAATLLGLGSAGLNTASSMMDNQKAMDNMSKVGRGLDTAGLAANIMSVAKNKSIPGATSLLPTAYNQYLNYRRGAQERRDNFKVASNPMNELEEMGSEFYTPTEYLRDGGYFGGNMSKFANGGYTEINVEGNELMIDPSNPGGGGVPRIAANYQNIPPHPEDGSLDMRGNVKAKIRNFVVPAWAKTKYETAAKTNDKLYADALMNNISRKKQQKEMEEATQQMYAEQEMTNGTPNPFEQFVAQYGGFVPAYEMGGDIEMYGDGSEVDKARAELEDLKKRRAKLRRDVKETWRSSDVDNWRSKFRKQWKDKDDSDDVDFRTRYKKDIKNAKQNLREAQEKANTPNPSAPGAGMFEQSTFEKALPYAGPLIGLGYSLFQKPFTLNSKDYEVTDRVKAYEDQYVPDYDLYNTAMYQMRKMAGASPAYLASAQGMYNRFAKGTAEEKRKVKEANQARKMAADVENLKIQQENAKTRMTIADYNEKMRSEQTNARLQTLIGETGLTAMAMKARENKLMEGALMSRYPEFFGLEAWNKECPEGKKKDANGNCV